LYKTQTFQPGDTPGITAIVDTGIRNSMCHARV